MGGGEPLAPALASIPEVNWHFLSLQALLKHNDILDAYGILEVY